MWTPTENTFCDPFSFLYKGFFVNRGIRRLQSGSVGSDEWLSTSWTGDASFKASSPFQEVGSELAACVGFAMDELNGCVPRAVLCCKSLCVLRSSVHLRKIELLI